MRLLLLSFMMSVTLSVHAATQIDNINSKLDAELQALKDELESVGNAVGTIVKCGDDAKVLKSGCSFIEEKNPYVSNMGEAVPSCPAESFLVVVGGNRNDVICKHISNFDYIHKIDPETGEECLGTPPAGKNYCRGGEWVSASNEEPEFLDILIITK